MTEPSTPEGTGPLTVDDAAVKLEALLTGDGDSDGDETEEETPQASEDEEQSEADEEQSETEDEEPEATAQPDDQTPIKLKLGEEEVEVTLHELKRGFLREQDYTRKTQALSEHAKAITAEREAEREQFAPLAARTQAIIGQLEQSLRTPLYSEQDMAELRYANPAEWSARRAEMDEHSRWVESILAHKDTLDTFQQQDADRRSEAERRELEAKVEQTLAGEFPDPAKLQEAVRLIAEHAHTIGVSREEWDEVRLDARSLMVLHDAAQWRALKAKTPKVQAKLQTVKTAAPGSKSQAPSKVTELTRSKQRLAQTGRVEDAAAAIERMLG